MPTTKAPSPRELDVRPMLRAGEEPFQAIMDAVGALAPGHRNRFEAPIATHNLLRAHGAAVQAYRAHGRHRVGLVVNIEPKYPASDAPADRDATARADAYMNRQYLDPVVTGRYPAELSAIFGEAWPVWPAEDFALIQQPIQLRVAQVVPVLRSRVKRPVEDGVGIGVAAGRVHGHVELLPLPALEPLRVLDALYLQVDADTLQVRLNHLGVREHRR